MAGEDLLEGTDGGTNDTDAKGGKGKKHKPLSKGQKIGAAIGAITILLVVYQIKKGQASSAASTTSSAAIDPQTGYPVGSAQDQAALATLNGTSAAQGYGSYSGGGGGGGGYYSGGSSTDSGTDPATGQSYSSELSSIGSEYTTLGNEYNSLQTEFSTWSSSPPAGTQPPAPTPPTGTPTGTVVKGVAGGKTGPTVSSSQNLANLNATLKRDEQGNTAGDKASVVTLNKQIAAVKARS
jgi:hypothetical protein